MTTVHCLDGDAPYKASELFEVLSDFATLILSALTFGFFPGVLKKNYMILGVFATDVL